jgi:hypothetical protein
MKGAQQIFFIDKCYDDPFNYKFTIITKVNLFNGYVDITHVDETSLRFAIHYFRSQWKISHLSIDVSYAKFNMKELKFISKIVIHLKQMKKRG